LNNPQSDRPTPAAGQVAAQVDRWLQDNGFQFNPFAALDAAADPHLHRYFVQQEAFDSLWGAWPSLVFEPRGGGKTALRARIVQACYIGQESNRPFPISYQPSFLAFGGAELDFAAHIRQIVTSAASQLLFSLVYRPHWYLRLQPDEQATVYGFLNQNLPGPLPTYLALMDDRGDSELLKRRLNLLPSTRIEPDLAQLLALRQALRQTAQTMPAQSTTTPWDLMMTVLKEIFKFKELYLLIDGLDAGPETADAPEVLVRACAPLWERATDWAGQQLFVKAFLPTEAEPVISGAQQGMMGAARIAAILWTEALLVEMLQQRVEVATQRLFSSLDALAVPGFVGIERRIVAQAPPLPREVLALTGAFLRAHLRQEDAPDRLHPASLTAGVADYRAAAPRGL
jgi:hypothetical protein